ncbi:MAG: DUF2490 domain-containing protein [Tannerella sp.]|nr:DUF2490 domain-containing protein [Tannerella sp.]
MTPSQDFSTFGDAVKGQTICRLRLMMLFMLMMMLITSQVSAQEQSTDIGLITSVEVEKSLSRHFDLSVEEELRYVGGFDRSVTSIGSEYALFGRKLKIGAYYALMYVYNNDRLYEVRHRYYGQAAYKTTCQQFSLSWRSRIQGTYRDEARGEYKINPKNILKNRLHIEYSIWGKPWKPFLSCETSHELNNPTGNSLTRIRYQGGVTWRLNRTDYLDFFLRYDDYPDAREVHVLSIGAGYKLKYP